MSKKIRIFLVLLLTTVSVACFAGTESSDSPENAANENRRSAKSNAAGEDAEDDPVKMEEVFPTAEYSQNTPTAAMKTWVMATVNKDVPALNGILSKAALQMLEKSAQAQGKTVGEILTGGAVRNISKNIPEFRNEKINGDTATVEYKDDTMKEFLAMPLVREDGKWKVAYDLFMLDMIRKLTEDMNNPAPKPAK